MKTAVIFFGLDKGPKEGLVRRKRNINPDLTWGSIGAEQSKQPYKTFD